MLELIQALLPVATAAGLVGLIGLELKVDGFRAGAVGPDRARTRRNWAFLISAVFTLFGVGVCGEAIRAEVPALLPWPEHPLANAVACFLVAELLGWLSHYVKHRQRWLWRFHVQHHREPHYDLWLVTHTHALEVLVSGAITTTVLVLLGFTPLSMQLYFSIYTLAKAYQHSSHPLTLGPLDKLIVGPAYHRLHHTIDAQVNFGIVITALDMLFGTARWPKRDEALEYGAPGEPYGFVEEMVYCASRGDVVEDRAPLPPARLQPTGPARSAA